MAPKLPTIYEYWRHQSTGEVWAVMLNGGRVVGAVQIDPGDAFLPYRAPEAAAIERKRQEFRRVDGRKVA